MISKLNPLVEQQRTPWFVLSTSPDTELNPWVRIYTPYMGALRVAFKQTSSHQKKMTGTSTLSLMRAPMSGDAALVQKRASQWPVLEDIQILIPWQKLAYDLRPWGWMCYATELLDMWVPDGEPDEVLWILYHQLFESFYTHQKDVTVLRAFELQLMHHLGYTPDFHDSFFALWTKDERDCIEILLSTALHQTPCYPIPLLKKSALFLGPIFNNIVLEISVHLILYDSYLQNHHL